MIRVAIKLPDGEIIELPQMLASVLSSKWTDNSMRRVMKKGLSERERRFVWGCLGRKWPMPAHMTVLLNRQDVLNIWPPKDMHG